jgi:hypothetical protein
MKHLKQVSGSRVRDLKRIAPQYEVEFTNTPLRSVYGIRHSILQRSLRAYVHFTAVVKHS